MRAIFVCAAFLCFSLLWLASDTYVLAYEASYLPLSSKVLSRRITQKLQADPLEIGHTLTVDKTKIELGTLLEVHGTDKAGKPWSYVSSSWTGSASIWSADLDKNGTEDLIILMPTGGCGWAPSYQMLVLLFEKNGRPLPWVVDGYFEVDSHGIKDFVDLENIGHCQLIRQSFDDGYWITSLYEAGGSRWHKMNTIAGTPLPLYTRFTTSQNHQAIHPPAFRHPFEADLNNDFAAPLASKSAKYIDEIDWPDVEHSQDPCLLFSDGKRSRPAAWYSTCTIVLDERSGRRMATLSASEAAHRLLGEISRRRIPISLCGARRSPSHGLSSEYVYAQGFGNLERTPPRSISMSRSLDAAIQLSERNSE